MPDYSVKLTDYGRAAIAQAETSGTPIVLTEIAVGDSQSAPTAANIALGNEVHRTDILEAVVDAVDPGLMRFTATITADIGGFWIREVGVFDSAGGLVYVAAFPEEYKPLLPASVAKECVIHLLCTVGNAANVNVTIDPSAVLATRQWVTDQALLPATTSGKIGHKMPRASAPTISIKTALEDSHVSLRKYDGRDDWTGPEDGIGPAIDNWVPLQKIITDYPAGCVIDLPMVESGVYYFSAIGYGVLNGFTLNPDPGVTLRFPSAWATSMPTVKCTRPVHLYFEDLKYSYYYSPYANKSELEKTQFMHTSGIDQSRVIPIDLANQGGHVVDLAWPDGPVSAIEEASTSYACTLVPPVGASTFRFMALPAFAGEDVSVCYRPDSSFGGGFVTFLVRLADGYAVLYQPLNGGIPQYGIKHGGDALAGPFSVEYKGRGTHASYWPEKSLCTIRVHNSRSFSLLYNGVEVWYIADTGSDITEIGFGGGYNPEAASINLTHWTRMVNKPFSGKRSLGMVVIGDSITDTEAQGSWTYEMREALESTHGIRVDNFLSLAVSGEASAQQLAHLQAAAAAGTLNAYSGGVMCIQIGVNDIQGQGDVNTYVSNVDQMIQIAKSNNMTVVAGLPTMFYTRGQSNAFGGLGQASANYDSGAYYRAAVLYSFAQNGVKPVPGVIEDLGPIVADYLATAKDPIMRDNIHPTAHGYRLMGYAYARAIAGALQPTVSRAYDRQFIADYLAIVQQDTSLFDVAISGNEASFRVTDTDLVTFEGFVNLKTALVGGQVGVAIGIVQLPRHLWPDRDIRVVAQATNNSGAPINETCFIHLQLNGTLNVYFNSTTPRGFYLDTIQYLRAWSGARR